MLTTTTPALPPLVAEKGFLPLWYGVAFAVYGVTLGLLSTADRGGIKPGPPDR